MAICKPDRCGEASSGTTIYGTILKAMAPNRSIPSSTVVPVLHYPDVVEAAEWLCRNYGFSIRLQIGTHRIQMLTADGTGAIVVREDDGIPRPTSVLVRVQDVVGLERRLRAANVNVLQPPTEFPYGERQMEVRDFNGHHWSFSETFADVDPASWLQPE